MMWTKLRSRCASVLTVFLGLSMLSAWIVCAAERGTFTAVDLQPQANQLRTDSLHGFQGNDFAELPLGEREYDGVRFHVGLGYVRLSGLVETGPQPRQPGKVEGIVVGRRCVRLHVLHGTGYGAFGAPGSALFVADGTPIGEYRVHYEDGTSASMPIVYGLDVRDWWSWEKPPEVSRGTVAWVGMNAFSRKQGQVIRLYHSSWSNPHPEKPIATLDFICNDKTAAGPFCLAISTQE